MAAIWYGDYFFRLAGFAAAGGGMKGSALYFDVMADSIT
jgi:hypothetical protein